MGGPYFEGQIPAEICGCYYPDVIALGDDNERRERVYHCVVHGEMRVSFEDIGVDEKPDGSLPLLPMPSEEWREGERKRLLTI